MSSSGATTKINQDRPPLRPVKLGPADVVVERRGDGAILMRSPHPLPDYPKNLTQRLVHWAAAPARRRRHPGAALRGRGPKSAMILR